MSYVTVKESLGAAPKPVSGKELLFAGIAIGALFLLPKGNKK